MRRLVVGLIVVLMFPVAVARAETTAPTPKPGAAGQALPMELPTREITFPVASLDGSMVEDGRTIMLRADVFFA